MAILIGVSGDQGSFSEEAAILYAQQKDIYPIFCFLIDMENVLSAVEQQTVNLGIFPVVNLQGGLVRPAFDAMGRHLFHLIDELWLHIRQCLLVYPGTTSQQIKKIVSHPQGLAQCKHYLQNEFEGVLLQEWCDTAKAARDLAEGILTPDTAVIASERSAELYGLNVFAKNIQDSNSNLTAFIVVEGPSPLPPSRAIPGRE
jgi:prephenate dehydratase